MKDACGGLVRSSRTAVNADQEPLLCSGEGADLSSESAYEPQLLAPTDIESARTFHAEVEDTSRRARSSRRS